MLLPFISILIAISLGIAALQIFSRLRHLAAVADAQALVSPMNRYQPMLRLLSSEDLAFVSANKPLARKLRAQRIGIFRDYMRCLTKDYGRLLAHLRLVMVQSPVDRPDLARVIASNRRSFVLAICRVELRLALYRAGIGKVDVSGLVEAIDTLRVQVAAFAPVALPAH